MTLIEQLKDRIQGKAPKGAKRSPSWSKIRAAHLVTHPVCQVCGSSKRLEVHHKIPFHLAPDMELSTSNLMTLCENRRYGINCHLLIGHLGNYRRFNSEVYLDAMIWMHKLKGG